MASTEDEWPNLDRLIAHRAPIRLVESIVRHSDGELVCRGVLPARDRTQEAVAAPQFLILELAAQTAAVMAALEGGGAPPESGAVGYLAAIREARFLKSEIPAGRRLRATVRRERNLGPLTMYRAEVQLEAGAVELLTAAFSTYLAASSSD